MHVGINEGYVDRKARTEVNDGDKKKPIPYRSARSQPLPSTCWSLEVLQSAHVHHHNDAVPYRRHSCHPPDPVDPAFSWSPLECVLKINRSCSTADS
jgi:hypothetical protein